MADLVNISGLLDEGKCFDLVRQMRWPQGVRCPKRGGGHVLRNGHDDKQQLRQRYVCRDCGARCDDLSHTVLAGHHQPLKVWISCLYLMGLNLLNQQIARELSLNASDVQYMTTQLRQGLEAKTPPVVLSGEVEIDEVYVNAGHKGNPAAIQEKGRPGRRSRLKAARGRGTLEKEKPSILGIVQRGGEIAIKMLANVKQATLEPLIMASVAKGALIYTDEYDIYARLPKWGYGHKAVCHADGEYLATRTATASMRFTSTRSRGSGRCYVRGYGPIAVFRRRNCRSISPSSSSSTTRESAERRCCPPSSKPSSPLQSAPFHDSNVPNFQTRAERPTVTPEPGMSQ